MKDKKLPGKFGTHSDLEKKTQKRNFFIRHRISEYAPNLRTDSGGQSSTATSSSHFSINGQQSESLPNENERSRSVLSIKGPIYSDSRANLSFFLHCCPLYPYSSTTPHQALCLLYHFPFHFLGKVMGKGPGLYSDIGKRARGHRSFFFCLLCFDFIYLFFALLFNAFIKYLVSF